MRAPSPALPSTAEAIEFLGEFRRELRLSDRLDPHIKEPIRLAVRGTDAPTRTTPPSPEDRLLPGTRASRAGGGSGGAGAARCGR